jgi:hypothetical protein
MSNLDSSICFVHFLLVKLAVKYADMYSQRPSMFFIELKKIKLVLNPHILNQIMIINRTVLLISISSVCTETTP